MSAYFNTIWPAEHVDSARHQFVNVDGLNVTGDLQIISNSELDVPIFSFTRETDELYSIGGSPGRPASGWMAKLNPDTLEEVAFADLNHGALTWSPSAVIHGDTYIYAVTGHVLYKLRSSDLGEVIPHILLPDGYEPESNLLVLSSGKLIVKGGRKFA